MTRNATKFITSHFGMPAALVLMFMAGACSSPSDKEPATDTAASMGTMKGMPGTGGASMMENMGSHMKMMTTMSADSMKAMLPEHRQMVANMIAGFNKEMRDMSMTADAAWNATVDSLRSDLNRMPAMTSAELKAAFPEHHARVMRLMQTHETMMKMMHGGMQMDSTTNATSRAVASKTTRVIQKELVTVYKTPHCTCCTKWVDHLKENGFNVKSVNMDDLTELKKVYGIPDSLSSCHTATVGKYVVEGHVPAEDVIRLLMERPKAVGLTVPGMPIGSPGMEGPRPEQYKVLLLRKGGTTEVYNTH